MNDPKLRPEVKAAWLEALRSGEYTQVTGHLHVGLRNSVDGYCCLGVLCELAADQGVVGRGKVVGQDSFGNPVYAYTDGSVEPVATAMPPQEVAEWAYDGGHANEYSQWMVTDRDGDVRQLSELNDDQELTFTEIADLIEDHL